MALVGQEKALSLKVAEFIEVLRENGRSAGGVEHGLACQVGVSCMADWHAGRHGPRVAAESARP